MSYSDVNDNVVLEYINSDKLLFSYLELLDSVFTPNLSTKVDLSIYSKKVSEKAFSRALKYKGEFAGLYIVYINDYINKEAYLTCIGVLEKFKGLGLSYILIDDMIKESIDSGMETIRLEVDQINHRAIRFYEKNGFIKQKSITSDKSSFYMNKSLLSD